MPHKKVAVKGKIINAETGEAICYPLIEIEAIGLKRRTSSEKGNFLIRNLEPGTYIIRCSHIHFHTIEVEFKHAWHETTELIIEMTPNPAAPPQTITNKAPEATQTTQTEPTAEPTTEATTAPQPETPQTAETTEVVE